MAVTSKQLKKELSNLTSKKSALENRIEDLKKIKRNIERLLDEVSDANMYYRNAKNYVGMGLKGVNAALEDQYDIFKQSGPTSDGKMSAALENVKSEIARCESEIESYETRISNKKRDISQAEKAEDAQVKD